MCFLTYVCSNWFEKTLEPLFRRAPMGRNTRTLYKVDGLYKETLFFAPVSTHPLPTLPRVPPEWSDYTTPPSYLCKGRREDGSHRTTSADHKDGHLPSGAPFTQGIPSIHDTQRSTFFGHLCGSIRHNNFGVLDPPATLLRARRCVSKAVMV